jgi:hypothetical protein
MHHIHTLYDSMQAHIMQGIHPNMTKDYSLEESLQSIHLQVTLNVYFPK